jgi:hypothetical protein
VQAIVEGFTYLLNDVEREKRWFETKWARQEKEIRKIIDSTQGMYADLQAVTGRSLPTIAALELPEVTASTGIDTALGDAFTNAAYPHASKLRASCSSLARPRAIAPHITFYDA